jgi:hypothetical protein
MLKSQPILEELNNRIDQVAKEPSDEEWQQCPTQSIDEQISHHTPGNGDESPYKTVKGNLFVHSNNDMTEAKVNKVDEKAKFVSKFPQNYISLFYKRQLQSPHAKL